MFVRHLPASLAVLLLLSVGVAAKAGDEASAVEKVYITEAGGTLEVAKDGSVAKVSVGEELAEPLRSALATRIGKLRFEPIRVHGEAVHALTGFHVVLEGKPRGGELSVAIDAIEFVTPRGMTPVEVDGQRDGIKALKMDPPKYPREQERSGRMARMKVALRIEADGSVGDVSVVDSMLVDDGKGGDPAVALRRFEKETTVAVRNWSFQPPADAAARSRSDMTCVTAVEYVFALRNGANLHKHGQWLPMYRAPKRAIAWLPAEDSSRVAETAVAAGNVSGGSSAFRLLTPIAGTPVL